MELLSALTKIDPTIIIQGGLTLAVIGLIWLNATSNKRYFNHTNDVIVKNNDAITRQAVSNEKLSNSIDRLVDHLTKKKK